MERVVVSSTQCCYLRVAIAAASVVTASSAVAESHPPYGGRIAAALYGAPAAVDPVYATTHAELTISRLVFDTLYSVDSDRTVVPRLATRMPVVAKDGMSAVITVRTGVVFHDGAVLAPADVAASLRRLMQSSSQSSWLLAGVRRVEVKGDGVVLLLRRPVADLAVRLAAAPAAITRAGRVPTWQGASGTGPYRLSSVDIEGRRIELVHHPRHFAGRGYLGEIELKWYLDPAEVAASYEIGELQMAFGAESKFVGHKPKYKSATYDVPAPMLVFLAGNNVPRALVAAVSLALDRRSFRSAGAGERVVPTVDAQQYRKPSRVLPRVGQARRDLANARRKSPSFDSFLATQTPVDIVYQLGRPGERGAAERVLAALFRLRIAGRVRGVSSQQLAQMRVSGRAFLYIDHLAFPLHPELGHAFEVLGRFTPKGEGAELAAGKPGSVASAIEQLSFVPLYYRFFRIHHRTDYHGVRSDSESFAALADVFQQGIPRRNP